MVDVAVHVMVDEKAYEVEAVAREQLSRQRTSAFSRPGYIIQSLTAQTHSALPYWQIPYCGLRCSLSIELRKQFTEAYYLLY